MRCSHLAPVLIVLVSLCWPLAFTHARDDGRYANSPLKPWFDGLRSSKGPCCSDADGSALSDSDWASSGTRYRVRIPRWQTEIDGRPQEMIWVDVPEDAVITEPNRAGRTMVWPVYGYGGVSIRCFMPGSMT
ncbi:hypothetical protein ABH973_006683 [Bradyrhizobium ottawaense]|uniref:hypothetical protein n=1 Tax=Bradyrhizobium ottawaense TaxID=931866 RepID=UPI00351175D7